MATNLWPNADLEANIDDWNERFCDGISQSSAESYEQTYSLLVDVNSGEYSGAETDYKAVVDPNTQYTISAYVLSAGADNALRAVLFGDDTGNLGANNQTANSSTWVRHVITFTTSADETTISLRITKNNHTGTVNFYVDAIMLETGDTASAWENYSSGVAFTVGNVGAVSIAALTPATIAANTTFTVGNVGNSSIAGYSPNTVIGTGLWEIGAYIYDVIGEIQVNVLNTGDVSINALPPALKADTTFTVGNVGGVSIASPDPTVAFNQDTVMGNVGAVVIAGFAAVVTGIAAAVGGGITRIAMKMATILRR